MDMVIEEAFPDAHHYQSRRVRRTRTTSERGWIVLCEEVGYYVRKEVGELLMRYKKVLKCYPGSAREVVTFSAFIH